MKGLKGDPRVAESASVEQRPQRLGIIGTLVLHSQYILIAGLVLAAVVLQLLAR